MLTDLSELREQIEKGGSRDEPRNTVVCTGNEAWHAECLNELLPGHAAQSLWLGQKEIPATCLAENLRNEIPYVTFRHAHHWLGGEKQLVIFDASEVFDVDAFAAISGIVSGGGFLILLMPPKEKWNEVYPMYFGQRLIKYIQDAAGIIIVDKNNKNPVLNFAVKNKVPAHTCDAPFLTPDQQNAVETITADVLERQNNAFVLVSDRGRGKSSALGLLAARLVKAGVRNIAVTAPRLRATDIIFKHIEQQLPGAVINRGCVQHGDSTIQFYPPDQLLLNDIEVDLLLVDEAAAIPVPVLTSCLNRFVQCVFATTVHGYEGTGRGFALRFNKVLELQKPGWISLYLQTPVRWPEDDPLEKWMFDFLCLDAEIVDVASGEKIELENLQHKVITQKQLYENETLLKEVFALLVLAHYRTRPSDLKTLLDDNALSLYVTFWQKHVIAVALVIREGQFTASLSTAVYRGERRPQGHLLAQALTYHCGIEPAAMLDYARVMRIAVHPGLQQQGIGTQLLDYIVSCERSHGRDAIGTSFGMNKLLLDFWKQAGFDLVRIGFTREQTSGEHAAIMLLPLSHNGIEVNSEAARRFNNQVSFWLEDVIRDIPDEIKQDFPRCEKEEWVLTADDKKDIHSFLTTSRNYELCIAALNKLVINNEALICQDDFPGEYRSLLDYKVKKKMGWVEISRAAGLTGKEEARSLFKSAIEYLVSHLDH